MAQRYSDVFGVSTDDFDNEGAFNGFIDIDSPFHIDPYLLHEVKIPELQGAYKRLRDYFDNIIHLLDASTHSYDKLYRTALSLLVFKEIPFLSLGYSKSGSSGNGIGVRLARHLTMTASEIIAAGIKDPIIFELAGLLEEGIGADRISDMTAKIILPDLMNYSQRVANNLGINTRQYSYQQNNYQLPFDPRKRRIVYLVPSEVLRHLPTAFDWSDIEYVCAYNEQLRRVVNEIVGDTWKQATRIPKDVLKNTILHYPGLLQDLIDQYSAKIPDPYDFENDPMGMLKWHDIAREFTGRYPLDLALERRPEPEQLLDVVIRICQSFCRLVEQNGLYRLFYDDDQNLRRERFAQLLFYGVADSYCEANNLDLSPEPNAGRGPVDFKLSRGYNAKVTVEVKYSSNPNLIKGFTTQLPIYNQAERTSFSVYLIIKTSEADGKINELEELRLDELSRGNRVPEIIVVDARWLPSASKA